MSTPSDVRYAVAAVSTSLFSVAALSLSSLEPFVSAAGVAFATATSGFNSFSTPGEVVACFSTALQQLSPFSNEYQKQKKRHDMVFREKTSSITSTAASF